MRIMQLIIMFPLMENMLQLIIFSILFGISTAMAGEVAKPIAKFVEAGAAVMMKIVNIIMYIAPIGLGCYFASLVGEYGKEIIGSYAKSMIFYIIILIKLKNF